MSDRNDDFEQRKALVQKMNIMDDGFFTKVAEDIPAMEEILCTLLGMSSMRLKWTRAQVFLRNCGTRSVVLDALCESKAGILYCVEMEKSNQDDHQRRVRYNASNVDTMYTEKGITFKEIPEMCTIYISKADFLKGGCCTYHVVRTLQENGREVVNGRQEIYVNAKVDDGTKIAELMKYMKKTKGEHPLFPKLSARVKYLKEQKEGIEMVGEAVEMYTREKVKEARKEARKEAKREARKEAKKNAQDSARNLFHNGVDFEVVAQSITQLTRTELERIYQQTMLEA